MNHDRGLRTNDVLLYGGEDVWLAGQVRVDDGGIVFALFVSPRNAHAEWVAILDPAAKEIFFLKNDPSLGKGPPPDRLYLGEIELRLQRRGTGNIYGEGDELPPLGSRANYALWRGLGGRLALRIESNSGLSLSLSGERIDPSQLDLLPGGDAK